ncbi:hypothetical protein B9479_006633 [Cryptococcus floricola]|uniref:Uncharacterized protein n=1 Tax=Cryptococcus floricola TaxID=2591691 RepID=A0A5D3AQ29_9TREE|nr:hypothetical protein B9479_006633 [Cryptococcus floricola]
MTSVNVTFDDFDPLLVFSDYSQWWTPDPSEHPEWYNATSQDTGVNWHEATVHYATEQGASFALNFTSPAIYIYGIAGPSSTNYTISLDGTTTSHSLSGNNSDTSVDDGRTLLWSQSGLETGKVHQVELTNEGSGVGVDLVVLEVDVGQNAKNTTVDNTSGDILYTSNWSSNNGNFYNGSSSYTSGSGNSLTFNFTGSALYVFGDQVNDHGVFSLYFNSSSTPFVTPSGRSGCQVANNQVEKSCEKLDSLKAFVGGLPAGEHQVEIVNQGQDTYFDFDYLVYTTPEQYPSFTLDATCANGICGDSSSANSTASASESASSSAASSTSTGDSGSSSSGAMRMGVDGLAGWMMLGWIGIWGWRRMTSVWACDYNF